MGTSSASLTRSVRLRVRIRVQSRFDIKTHHPRPKRPACRYGPACRHPWADCQTKPVPVPAPATPLSSVPSRAPPTCSLPQDIQSSVLEIMSTNVSTTYITCPADPQKTLGIKLPFLVMIIKNLKKYFSFEVQVTAAPATRTALGKHLLLVPVEHRPDIATPVTRSPRAPECPALAPPQVLDDKNVRRRFRASNYQSTTRVKPFICTMPMRLDEGWNQIQFNLSDFTRRAYGTNYVETLRVQIHANCRIRRIYFSDRLYSEEELPDEFKLYLPVQKS